MKTITAQSITEAVKKMCIEANTCLSPDMKAALKKGEEQETSEVGKNIFQQLKENLKIAEEERIPICQDTGMAVFFVKLGQEIYVEGGLTEAINEGVRQGYTEGYLRKSVVEDPMERINTKDNTPAVIHYDVVPGDQLVITLAPKGAGSENVSRVFMLKPADGMEGIENAVLTAVKDAGPNACPPMVVGVGIGGNFEQVAYLAKKALTQDLNNPPQQREWVTALKVRLLEKINATGIGPAGLGGKTTALAVNIETAPTHIAQLPVAINICCHVNRHKTVVL